MDPITRAFREHPASVGESYLQHMRAALGFSATMIAAAGCCAVHAFLPFLFQKTGSTAIDELYQRMLRQRVRGTAAARHPQPPPRAARDPRAAA
ncbi:MAG TPA: DUF6356 family protein [Gammaproteobacteria bacterium]|nr:DUF6356 family protein [Gammaproteobacteria bacterium]